MESPFPSQPVFEEVQEAPWPVMALGLGATAAGGAAVARAISLMAGISAVALTALGAGLVLREFLVPLRTTLLDTEIQLLFGKRTRYRIPLKHVVRAYPRTYSAVSEYGGWGIRIGPGGRAFNMRGNQGVQLELKSGQKVLIGSQRPDELAEAIRRLTGARGASDETVPATIVEEPVSAASPRTDSPWNEPEVVDAEPARPEPPREAPRAEPSFRDGIIEDFDDEVI